MKSGRTEAELFLLSRGVDLALMRDSPCSPRRFFNNLMQSFKLREDYIGQFSFAVLTEEMVELLRPYEPILEVGSGNGYWAWELARRAVAVTATDPGTGRYRCPEWKSWTAIDRLTAVEAVRKWPDLTLLLVWPDYGKPWAVEALREWRGKYAIYVGEWRAATADEAFHDLLEQEFVQEREVEIPMFDGLHDRLWIFRRK